MNKLIRLPVLFFFLLIASWLSDAIAQTATREDKAKDITAMLLIERDQNQELGAGIIFGYDNSNLYIATANHLVRPRGNVAENGTISVFFHFIQGQYDAMLLNEANPELDLALLRVQTPRDVNPEKIFSEVKIFDNTLDLKRESDMYAIGYANPSGGGWDRNLIPHKFDRVVGSTLFIEVQSQNLLPGYSGGGLFTPQYELIGMIKSGEGGETTNVEAESFSRIMQDLDRWNLPTNVFRQKTKKWRWAIWTGAALAAGGGACIFLKCLQGEESELPFFDVGRPSENSTAGQ